MSSRSTHLPSQEHEGFYPHASYTYHDLPARYWKKYQYASQFVQLVRSKTPKVTFYSDQAKCMLMENAPNPDFEACFYSGKLLPHSLIPRPSPSFRRLQYAKCIVSYGKHTASDAKHIASDGKLGEGLGMRLTPSVVQRSLSYTYSVHMYMYVRPYMYVWTMCMCGLYVSLNHTPKFSEHTLLQALK